MSLPDSTLLLQRAAAAAAADQQYPAGALYVVATPIGNLADLTLRAIHVLGLVDCVACEDTRSGARLLRYLGIDKPLLALHAHNERGAASTLAERLAAGARVAFISDAGTPAISDPGARLVAEVSGRGLRVVPIPGASTLAAAISVAGATEDATLRFVGFLPAKGKARADAVAALRESRNTVVLFEAPHRIARLAGELAGLQRRVTLCRELTKQFESVQTLPAADLLPWFDADPNRLRGEFALVVHAEPALEGAAAGDESNRRMLAVLLRELPLKQAVAIAAELNGAPRNDLYRLALEIQAGRATVP